MNILITGAGGFVAYHLINKLDVSGSNIYGVDVVQNKSVSVNNAKYLFQKLDLLDKKSLFKTISFVKPDYIYHLAGISFVPDSVKSPEKTYYINFLGTFNLLEAVRTINIKPKVLVVSSADVYSVKNISHNKDFKINENHPVEPHTPYAVSKLAVEILSRKYWTTDKIPIVIVRPFNHTGPYQRTDFAPPAFAKRVVDVVKEKKSNLIETGNTKVWRDYTDVRDVVDAYVRVIECSNGEIYNVCNGKSIEIAFILNYFIEKSGLDIKRKISPALFRTDIDKYVCGDNEKIFNATGWKSQIDILTTLDDIYNSMF